MGLEDSLEKVLLRDRFIKEDLRKIVVEGVNVDEVYVREVVERGFKGALILDVGTGTAHIPLEIVKRSKWLRFVALDLSSASVKIAKKNVEVANYVKNIFIVRADGYNLPFRDFCFAEVIIRLAPHSIKEAYRVLKTDGWYILRACGKYNCWKEVHEIFGERTLPFTTAEWWKTSIGRLERLAWYGFKEVYEMSFLVRRYYTLDQIIREMMFDPIVKDFNAKEDMLKLKELERKFKTEKGIRITGYPLILFGRK